MSRRQKYEGPEIDYEAASEVAGKKRNRRAQLDALNRIRLSGRLFAYGKTVSEASVMIVMRSLDDHQRDGACCWPSYGTIADCTKLSVKTVARAIRILEDRQLITVTSTTDRDGHPMLIYSINWQVVFGKLPEETTVKRRRRRGRFSPKPEDTGTMPEDTGTMPEDTRDSTLYRNREKKRPLETARPPGTRHTHPGSEFLAPPVSMHDEWWKVEGELNELGVRGASAAVKGCKDRVSVEHGLALCRHFREHANRAGWDEIVLYHRVRSASPDKPVEAGWPGQASGPVATSVPAGDLQKLSDDQIADLIRRFGSPVFRRMLEMGNARTLRESDQWRPELLRILEREGVPA